ncbi:aminotransferase class IV family protein [Streptomyces sp. AV19]|uniref:aminotransferase class IV family protein n=1 Tax=Streptomyces sp. AV19 TaxID=2793068 RepID=UPI0018FE8E74|nr:aminotransferase class IV family protein [Streptomyces sp. AV19]MBH1937592.1 aminotransferase class IV family protein [Streptomyces sp. AV19]MDG4536475.1 aminotransferase class IV family protein [Streptomyces sp. AV19]
MELNGRPADPDALATLALTNYGHFTTMRVDNGRVRGLGLHMERLAGNCRDLFGAELDTGLVRAYVARAVPGVGSLVVRVTVFDPALELGHPSAAATPHILVTTRPAGPATAPPFRVRTVTHVRDAPTVKNVGLFGLLRARREAQLAGFDDALFIGPDGRVSEGGTWNVAFVDADGTVVWPEAEVLPGITMALVRRDEHIVAPVTTGDLPAMRAAFATNAAIGVRAIAAVDDVRLDAGHPVVKALQEAYLGIEGELV